MCSLKVFRDKNAFVISFAKYRFLISDFTPVRKGTGFILALFYQYNFFVYVSGSCTRLE